MIRFHKGSLAQGLAWLVTVAFLLSISGLPAVASARTGGADEKPKAWSRPLTEDEMKSVLGAWLPGQPPAGPPKRWDRCGAGGLAGKPTCCGSPYDQTAPGSGNWFQGDRPVAYGSVGMATPVALAANSRADYSGPMGPRWTHAYNIFLTGLGTPQVTLNEGDGTQWIFLRNVDGSYTSPAGNHDKLEEVPGGYRLTRSSQLVLNFDGAGTLTSIVDPNNNTWTLAYSGGRLSSVTDPKGRVTSYSYDGYGRLSGITVPGGLSTTIQYDGAGRVWQVTDAANATTTYGYDANNRVSSISPPGGGAAYYSYDGSGRVTQITDVNGGTISYVYGSSTVTITDQNGDLTVLSYDANGNLLSEHNPLETTTSYAYDADHNRVSIYDTHGHMTNFTYDANGNMLTRTDPLYKVTTYTYDSKNHLTSVTDPLGHRTEYTYSPTTGNLTQVKDALNYTTNYSYYADGNVYQITDPRGKVTTHYYNANGYLTQVTDPLGRNTYFGNNAAGDRTSVTDPNNNTTTYQYDGNHHVTRITYPDVGNGAKSKVFGWSCCYLTSVTDENGKITTYEYYNPGWLKKVTDAKNQITQYEYDGTGRLKKITNARAKITNYTYSKDMVNHLLQVRTDYPDATYEISKSDGDGLLKVRQDGRGYVTNYGYDNADRLTLIDYPAGTDTTFAYNDCGFRTSMADGGVTTYSPDALHRAASITHPAAKTFSYQWDGAGNRTRMTDSDNGITNYTYTDRNELYQLTNPDNQTTTFTYDNGGRRTLETFSTGYWRGYSYNARNWLTGLSNVKSDGTIIWSCGYPTFDNVGNLTYMVENDASAAYYVYYYTYDDIYQLTTEMKKTRWTEITIWTRSYSHDAVGNRTQMVKDGVTTIYVYDDNNKLSSSTDPGGTTSYSYDNNGNTTQISAPGPHTTSMGYNYENLMVSHYYDGVQTGSYAYNGAGLRVRRLENGVTTRYIYDGDRIVLETNNVWVTQARYTIEGGSYYDRTSSMKRGGVTYWYAPDWLGSTRKLVNASKQITDSYEYDAFGSPIASSGSTSNPYRYVGRLGYNYSSAVPFLHVGARWYGSGLGRFASQDPLGQGDNWYSYASGNPTNFVDPQGLIDWRPWKWRSVQWIRRRVGVPWWAQLGAGGAAGYIIFRGYGELFVRVCAIAPRAMDRHERCIVCRDHWEGIFGELDPGTKAVFQSARGPVWCGVGHDGRLYTWDPSWQQWIRCGGG